MLAVALHGKLQSHKRTLTEIRRTRGKKKNGTTAGHAENRTNADMVSVFSEWLTEKELVLLRAHEGCGSIETQGGPWKLGGCYDCSGCPRVALGVEGEVPQQGEGKHACLRPLVETLHKSALATLAVAKTTCVDDKVETTQGSFDFAVDSNRDRVVPRRASWRKCRGLTRRVASSAR